MGGAASQAGVEADDDDDEGNDVGGGGGFHMPASAFW
jgi:hypothetical protein